MKSILFILLSGMSLCAHAQFSDESSFGRLRAGFAYVHDFPGLNGGAASIQYSFPLNSWLEGGIGASRIQSGGYPRTHTVREYTHATTLDFSLLFVPFQTESSAVRVGASYSFSFYNIRRSYPVYAAHDNQASIVDWPVADARGRVHGMGVTAEYEYNLGEKFSAGAKLSLCKAYNYVIAAGPFVSIRL